MDAFDVYHLQAIVGGSNGCRGEGSEKKVGSVMKNLKEKCSMWRVVGTHAVGSRGRLTTKEWVEKSFPPTNKAKRV